MKDRLRQLVPDLLIALVLFVAPLILFAPQTLGGRTLLPAENLYQWEPYRSLRAEVGAGPVENPLVSDLVLQNLEWKQFAKQEIAAGRIPLWQPNILAGSPFLAAGQSSTLYPFSLIYLLLPLPAAYGWFTVVQLWLAGLNMYLLLRVLGVRRVGALASGLAYQLSGFFVFSAVFPMILGTAAWLPLAVAMAELVIRQQPALGRPASLPWVFGGAAALGMAALAGHVEALYFTLLVVAFYAAARLIAEAWARRRDGMLRWLAPRALWLVVMAAAGLALGAVQVIPAYVLATRSFRQEAPTFAEVRSWAFQSGQVIAFFVPDYYGNPAHHRIFDVFQWHWVPLTHNAAGEGVISTEWGLKNAVEGAAYMGLLPMLLAVLALAHWVAGRFNVALRTLAAEAPGRPYRLTFGVLAVLSIAFAFGSPIYAILYYGLPGFNQSHAPFRWVWPLTFAAAALAGFGVEALARAAEAPASRFTPRAARVLGWLSVGVAAVAVIGLVVTRVAYPQVDPWVAGRLAALKNAPNIFPDSRLFYSYQATNFARLALVLALTGGALLWAARGRRVARWTAALAAVIAFDLMLAGWAFNPAGDPALLDVTPSSVAWLQDRYDPLDPWRLHVYEDPGADTLNANLGWLHGLETVDGYDSLITRQYARFMDEVAPQFDLFYNRIAPLYSNQDFPSIDSMLLDVLGVRYVVTETTFEAPDFRQVYEDDAVRIYQNDAALPRAYLLPVESTVLNDADDPLVGFSEMWRYFDPRRQLLVSTHEGPFAEPPAPEVPLSEPVPATITSNTPQQMTLDAAPATPSWLVVTNSYFPGWRAWVRPQGTGEDAETEVPIYRVNANFQGIVLEPGSYTVRLKYSPDDFRFGAFASFLTGLALVFAVGVWAWRSLYTERGEGADVQRVAKNTAAPVVLNLFNKGIAFVLTFAMLRILGPAGAGAYRWAIVVFTTFDILVNFGLNTFLTREVARRRDDAARYLVATTGLRLGLAVLGVPVLAGFLLGWQALVEPLSRELVWVTGLLYSGLFFSTISTGLTALFYAYERAETPAAVQTVSAFLTTALGIGALLAGWGIVGLAGASVVVNAVTLAILGVLAVRAFFPNGLPSLRSDWSLGRLALAESFPLMLNHLLATLFFRIDVLLLKAFKGDEVVGWYSVVYTWVDAIMVIPSYFTLSLFPVMSRQAVEDRDALRRAYVLAVKLLTLLSVPLAVGTTLLAPVLVRILGGTAYLPHGAIAMQIFIWSIVIGWINSVTQYVLIALDRQRTLTVAFVVGAVFNIAANVIFIPRYSYPAAAVITIFSEAVLWVTFVWVLRGELRGINWPGMLWKIAAAGALSGGAAWLLHGVNLWLAFGAAAGVYAGVLLALRPLSESESALLAGALPAGVRARLMPRQAVG